MPILVLFSCVVFIVGTQYAAVFDLVHTALRSVTYQHCLLVPVIVGWLMWRQRHRLSVQFSPVIGFSALLVAWSTQSVGFIYNIHILMHAAVWLGMVSACLLCIGTQQCRRLWAPLLFLGFMVPFGDFLIPYLQHMFAVLASVVLSALGVDLVRNGLLIHTQSAGTFIVAEACAGLRFLVANVMVGALFAMLTFKTARYSVLFLLVCTLVPLVGNLLRICGVIGIAVVSDGSYGVGFDHLVYGWGFFSVLMVLNLHWGSVLARREAALLHHA